MRSSKCSTPQFLRQMFSCCCPSEKELPATVEPSPVLPVKPPSLLNSPLSSNNEASMLHDSYSSPVLCGSPKRCSLGSSPTVSPLPSPPTQSMTAREVRSTSRSPLRYSPLPRTQYDKSELKQRLTPLQYQITQEKGTERAFSGSLYREDGRGIYSCIVCETELFTSATKYNSGSGWPAFSDILSQDRVHFKPDASHLGGNLLLLVSKPDLVRTEVTCAECGSHLGHLFSDGPPPTNQRYCVNSASLKFQQDDTQEPPQKCKFNSDAKNCCKMPVPP